MKRRVRLVSLAMPLLAAASSTYATQLYVAPTGSDSNACTQSAPCRQIRRAISRAVPGDTINVADGSYLGFTIDGFTASASAPLTIVAPTKNAQVTATSDRGDNEANIYVYGSAYVVIDGLKSFSAPRFGVRVSHSNHVTVRNGVFGNNGYHGIFSGHADDLVVEDNECYGSKTSHGIYVSNSGDRPIVRRNRSHNNVKAGIQLNADASSGGDGIISGALIEANFIYDNAGDSSAINLDGVQDSVIRNNVIFRNAETAITFFQIDGAAGPKGNQVLHNTIDVPSNGRSGLVFRDTVGPNYVRNNILINRTTSSAGIKFGNSTDVSNTDSDYNVLDRATGDDGNTVLSLSQWKSQGHETHSLSATPSALWVDSANGNYHLASSSPAIDRGQTLTSVTTDIEGNRRPAGASSDIGAYEAGAGSSASQLSIADVRLSEGNSGTTTAAFPVILSPAASSTVTVNWATSGGTATAGSDYTAASGTLSFAAGETSKTVSVAVTGDTQVEGDETFYVTLSGAGGATISRSQATGTIANDDSAAGVSATINDVSVNEGNSGTTNAVLTVRLSAAASQTVSLSYTTANGTAAAPADYSAQAGTVSFAPGETSKAISVPVVGDTTVEPNETFVVNLSSPIGTSISDGQGQVTIIDNDSQAPPPTTAVARVNAGGPSFTDASGNLWDADRAYNTGNVASASGTWTGASPQLYATERWDPSAAPELSYVFPVAAGTYTVNLHFAEIYYTTAGARQFDVYVNGTKVIDHLDIVKEVGPRAPLVKSFTVNVTGTSITVGFVHQVENPKVSGIEILAASSPPPPPAGATRVNAGGPSFTDASGNAWLADKSYNTGNVGQTSETWTGANASLYTTERWDPSSAPELAYTFPVSAGTYAVKLHFAEIYSGAAFVGGRQFDVSINGTKVLDHLDVYKEVGFMAPLVKTFTVNVTGTQLVIAFAHQVENPKVSGIEIIPQ